MSSKRLNEETTLQQSSEDRPWQEHTEHRGAAGNSGHYSYVTRRFRERHLLPGLPQSTLQRGLGAQEAPQLCQKPCGPSASVRKLSYSHHCDLAGQRGETKTGRKMQKKPEKSAAFDVIDYTSSICFVFRARNGETPLRQKELLAVSPDWRRMKMPCRLPLV